MHRAQNEWFHSVNMLQALEKNGYSVVDRVIQKDQIDEVIDNIQYPMSLFSVYLLNYLQRKEGI